MTRLLFSHENSCPAEGSTEGPTKCLTKNRSDLQRAAANAASDKRRIPHPAYSPSQPTRCEHDHGGLWRAAWVSALLWGVSNWLTAGDAHPLRAGM